MYLKDKIISPAPSWNAMKTASVALPSGDLDEVVDMLRKAVVKARESGYEAIVGPMVGGTWGSYRIVTWTDGSPSFLGEPQSKPLHLVAFRMAGFDIAETHFTAVTEAGSKGYAAVGPEDVTLRHWNGVDPEKLLADAHAVVMEAFAKTAFFTPIPREHFIGAYAPMLDKSDPRFILEARDGSGRAVGFTLAYPDPLRQGAVVLKTYAGLVPGIGRRMADMIHSTAADIGYTEVVHALMREGIASANQSRKFGGRTIRKYALMGQVL